jgi:site-specific recombinase XerD
MSALAPMLERYFSEYLVARRVSPRTVEAYRDAFCLLLGFAQRRLHKRPANLDLADLDATVIAAFLDHLENDRRNSITTRNLRLAAIHGFYSYAALRCPEHAALIQRVLAIPRKRTDSRLVTFLTRPEVEALLAAPDLTTWSGRRDRALLAVAVQTGLRVAELTSLTGADVNLAGGPAMHCVGKGRKERWTPLTTSTARVLRAWLAEQKGPPDQALFPSRSGGRLSTDAVADLVAKHVTTAAQRCPSLLTKRVTPHTLRHTAAMNLLQAGVDTATIALWLGHTGIKSTAIYIHADLAIKQKALDRTAPTALARGRFRPSDQLLTFLHNL